MFIIYLSMRKSCSALWTSSHVINIILRGMIKGWWYRYQSRQTHTVVMFFQYYICKFPLFSTKYMINVYIWNTFVSNLLHSVKFLKCLSITSRDCHGILGNMFRFDGQWLTWVFINSNYNSIDLTSIYMNTGNLI